MTESCSEKRTCPYFDGERYCGIVAAEVCGPALAMNRIPPDPAYHDFCMHMRSYRHGVRYKGMEVWEKCWRYQRARADEAEKKLAELFEGAQ
jgi:hypothetical protein